LDYDFFIHLSARNPHYDFAIEELREASEAVSKLSEEKKRLERIIDVMSDSLEIKQEIR